jgi:2-polyprenyl-6-methoxyphenol hydroxylase-like FAD-dependent oxidoreductase
MNPKVIIVGAGPVGLLLGNLLGSKGISALILEKNAFRHHWSKAIGISPPSLGILHQIHLDQLFIAHGLKGTNAIFHNHRFLLGSLQINDKICAYPYILALSQEQTETLLEKNLEKYECVKVLRGYRVTELNTDVQSWVESGKYEKKVTEKPLHLVRGFSEINSRKFEFTAEIVCACDGEKSAIRRLVGIPFVGNFYKQTFIMGDYYDRSNLGASAALWFTSRGSVESFPLSNQIRRWIIQTDKNPKPGYLEKIVKQRTKISIDNTDCISQNPFSVQRFLAAQYTKDQVFLCGDSAHTMSPIGGQGMNTGFADAEFLAYMISKHFSNPTLDLYVLAKKYEFYRKIAARSATFRAHLGMTVGTAKGWLISLIRSLILLMILHLPLRSIISPFFLMTNIPYNRLSLVCEKEKRAKHIKKK